MHQEPKPYINELLYKTNGLPILSVLELLAQWHPGNSHFLLQALATKDQVITDMILANKLPIKIFTLDTGRLFAETYSVWTANQRKIPNAYQSILPTG
jgi:phosphoadenosine phosphosulfate reductase